MQISSQRKSQAGGVLVMFALAMVVIIGGAGLAVDIGRMYVNRTEAQSFVDSLALARAAEMIGSRVVNNGDVWKLYDFNNQSFDGANVIVDYSSGPGFAAGTVTAGPTGASLYVRARATVDVPLVLLPVVVGQSIGTVSAQAIAGLEQLTGAGAGLFPYVVRSALPGGGGFDVGTAYTFRWGNNVSKDVEDAWKFVSNNFDATTMVQGGETELDARLRLTAQVLRGGNPFPGTNPPNINVWCEGHATVEFLRALYEIDDFDSISSDLFSWTGSFYQGGTRDIVDALCCGYQERTINLGDSIEVATGVRQATVNELRSVINSDTDTINNNPADYDGNYARVIFAPVVDAATAFLKPGSGASAEVIAFETFLLMVPASSYGNPQSNWCAVYAGPYEFNTETPVPGGSGVWVLRLVS
jgi:hypothetical protein